MRRLGLVMLAACRIGFDQGADDAIDGGNDIDAPGMTACGPAVTSAAAAGSTTDVTTLTIAQLDAGSDNGRLLVVGAGLPSDAATWQSVTFDGIALTRADSFSSGSRAHAEVWFLADPPAGLHDVVLTTTTPRAAAALALAFRGVDSANPIGEEEHAGGTSGASSVNVDEASDDDLIVDAIVEGSDAIGREFDATDLAVPGPGQTECARAQDMAASRNVRVIASTKSAAETTTVSWTLSGSYDHAHIAVAVRAARCP